MLVRYCGNVMSRVEHNYRYVLNGAVPWHSSKGCNGSKQEIVAHSFWGRARWLARLSFQARFFETSLVLIPVVGLLFAALSLIPFLGGHSLFFWRFLEGAHVISLTLATLPFWPALGVSFLLATLEYAIVHISVQIGLLVVGLLVGDIKKGKGSLA